MAELPKKLKLIIMGDLNCNLLLPNLSVTKKLQLLLEVANVCIPSHEVLPTRVTVGSASCLDFIAIDRSLTTTEYLVSDLLLSDHLPVIASLTIPSPPPAVPVLRRSFKSTDYLELGTKLDNIILTTPISINQLDEQLDCWYAEVGALLDTYAPQRKYPRLNKVVPSNKITRDLTNQRNALSRRINKVDPSEKGPLLALINNLNKRIKSQTRASLKAAANDAVLNHQPKDMWKFINNVMFRKTKHSDINNQPEIFQLNNFFGSLVEESRSIPTIGSPSTTPIEIRTNQPIAPIVTHTNEPITSNASHTSGSQLADLFSLRPVTNYTTLNLLQNIKGNTAMGHDKIPAFFLKKWAPFLVSNITLFFNSSLSLGVFPLAWKKANITPVYKKKGSKKDPENYRPISILPVLGRLLEKAVAIQLQEHCGLFDIIPVQQFGFRKHSNCELALVAALDTWLGEASCGNFVGALLVDLSKAFDSVSHELLCNDLSDIGCDAFSLGWFRNYLTSRYQRVVIGDSTSPWLAVSKGVPQGSSLSPLLFNIFVRLLPHSCDGDVFQFADDLTNSISDCNPAALSIKLENAYNKIKVFCDNKMLQINLTKTQLIIFKSPNKSLPPDYCINLEGIPISPSSTVQILGVTLDQHFTMGMHIQNVAKKCHGLLGVLRRAASYLPPSLLTLAYISLIRTHLEFCSATFYMAAPSHLKKLDVIQKITSRIITNSPPCPIHYLYKRY